MKTTSVWCFVFSILVQFTEKFLIHVSLFLFSTTRPKKKSSRRLLWSINFVLSGLKRRRFTQSTSNKFTGKHHWYQFALYSQENVNFNVVHIELSGKQCLKTDGLKGLLQNSKRQTCFCFGFFPGGDRPPPWFFLVFTKEITSK